MSYVRLNKGNANKRANDRDIYRSNKLLLDIAMQKHNKDKLVN